MNSKKIQSWITVFLINILALLTAYIFSFTTLFENLELKTLDVRFRLRGEMVVPDTNIVVVAIDDQTFTSLNTKWPFPRSYFAHLIKNLTDAGARLVILDVTFTEPAGPAEDSLLAGALADAGNVILAGKIVNEVGRQGTANNYLIKPIPLLEQAALAWGLVSVPEDQDGFVRRYLLYQHRRQELYFPLALEVLKELQNYSYSQTNENDLFLAYLEKQEIEKYDLNSMLINFRGPAATFPTYSFSNVLDDSTFFLAPEEDTNIFDYHREYGTFQGKIVFVGASTEELQDNKLTPFFNYEGNQQKTPGVEVHANALSTLLQKDYIYAVARPNIILALIGLIAIAGIIAHRLSPLRGFFLTLGEAVAVLLVILFLFIHFNYWVPTILPALSILLAYGGNVIYRVVKEQREKGIYRKTFEHYVASNVVETMLKKGEVPKFGGERRELTVLFSDIRSFTTFSEKFAPEVVVKQLSEYLSDMTDIIFKNQGTLDKFVGDEIMALFGAPYYYEDHAFQACRTAVEMIYALRKIQENWSRKNIAYFHIGIGINTGKVIVGNLGSRQLFDYTVIGDEVNLGARLEGTNKQYQTSIIISESTYLQVKDRIIVRELDFVRVKGKHKPVRIYELRGIEPLASIEQELIIDSYLAGLTHYKNRRWYQALKEFRMVLRYFPSDGPSRLYTNRCLNFIMKPPPDDWDGVFVFATK